MNKREKILVGTVAVLVVLCITLAVAMFTQKPKGNVDLGYGYTATRAEFDEYSAIAEQTTKDVLLELKIVQDAAKELGVSVTDSDIQQEVDSMNLIYNYEKGTSEYCDLKVHAIVTMLETKCIDALKSKVDISDEEISEYLESIANGTMLDCEFKNVSTVEGIVAKTEKVKYEDVESKYTVLDTGTETAISVEPEDGQEFEVGGTYTQENGEDTYAIYKVTKLYKTDAEKREGAIYRLTKSKAEDEFYNYIAEFYEGVVAGYNEDGTAATSDTEVKTDGSKK